MQLVISVFLWAMFLLAVSHEGGEGGEKFAVLSLVV